MWHWCFVSILWAVSLMTSLASGRSFLFYELCLTPAKPKSKPVKMDVYQRLTSSVKPVRTLNGGPFCRQQTLADLSRRAERVRFVLQWCWRKQHTRNRLWWTWAAVKTRRPVILCDCDRECSGWVGSIIGIMWWYFGDCGTTSGNILIQVYRSIWRIKFYLDIKRYYLSLFWKLSNWLIFQLFPWLIIQPVNIRKRE